MNYSWVGNDSGSSRRRLLRAMTVGIAGLTAGCTMKIGGFSVSAGEDDDSTPVMDQEKSPTRTPTATLRPTPTQTPLTISTRSSTPHSTSTTSTTPTPTPTPTPVPTPIPRQEFKFVAGDGDEEDYFGESVALDGDTALVGAVQDEHPYGPGGSGSAYVFVRTGTEWVQQAKLVPETGGERVNFGHSVAVNGDTALVSAPRDDDPNGFQSGSVYVFGRDRSRWIQRDKLSASDGDSTDRFGWSVAFDGDTAVIGSTDDDDPNGKNSGSVYVFRRHEREMVRGSLFWWSQEAKLVARDGDDLDYFGYSVAVDGDTVLVGAWGDEHPYGSLGGSAYVFTRSKSGWDQQGWSQQAKLLPRSGGRDLRFGIKVALSGDTALVGAPGGDAAYVFTRSGSEWSQQAKLVPETAGEQGNFGRSGAVYGDTALVGAYSDADPNGPNSGLVYLYIRSQAGWRQATKLTASDGDASDQFGNSIALAADTAIVTAALDEDPNGKAGGSAYVFWPIGSE